MILIWRGWGFLSILIPLIFLMLPPLLLANLDIHEPDGTEETRVLLQAEAIALASAGLLQDAISRHRERAAPDVDTLLFMPARYWVGFTAASATVMLLLSFLGLDLLNLR